VSFCITGVSHSWHIAEAYRLHRQPQSGYNSSSASSPVLSSSRFSNISEETHPSQNAWPTLSESQGRPSLEASSDLGAGPSADGQSPSNGNISGSRMQQKLQEKIVSGALHLGCRGPAAKVAGAAAAMTVEGYALYKEIDGHRQELGRNVISDEQYTEKICESSITSSGRAIGSLAGAAIGQASIPVPVVGAVIGGVVGGACGGFHANSLIKGAWRLSGGKAKGGDDLVRCVDHTEGDEASVSYEEQHVQAPASPIHHPGECQKVSGIDDDQDLL